MTKSYRYPNKKKCSSRFFEFKKTFSFFSEITYRYQNLAKMLQTDCISNDLRDFA